MVAVGNAYEMAPWAAAVVANDKVWWEEHPQARKFAGRKFTTKTMSGIERHRASGVGGDSNSGTLGIDVAVRVFKATQVLLIGFDFHGTHFFGQYQNRCSNTTAASRVKHQRQMNVWRKINPRVEVVNLTAGSELKAFPMGNIEDYL